jgi:hypothetical protein
MQMCVGVCYTAASVFWTEYKYVRNFCAYLCGRTALLVRNGVRDMTDVAGSTGSAVPTHGKAQSCRAEMKRMFAPLLRQ